MDNHAKELERQTTSKECCKRRTLGNSFETISTYFSDVTHGPGTAVDVEVYPEIENYAGMRSYSKNSKCDLRHLTKKNQHTRNPEIIRDSRRLTAPFVTNFVLPVFRYQKRVAKDEHENLGMLGVSPVFK